MPLFLTPIIPEDWISELEAKDVCSYYWIRLIFRFTCLLTSVRRSCVDSLITISIGNRTSYPKRSKYIIHALIFLSLLTLLDRKSDFGVSSLAATFKPR